MPLPPPPPPKGAGGRRSTAAAATTAAAYAPHGAHAAHNRRHHRPSSDAAASSTPQPPPQTAHKGPRSAPADLVSDANATPVVPRADAAATASEFSLLSDRHSRVGSGERGEGSGPRRRHPSKAGRKSAASSEKPAAKGRPQMDEVVVSEKYFRGKKMDIRKIPNGEVKHKLAKAQEKIVDAAITAKQTELLLPETAGFLVAEDGERTYKFTQRALVQEVDLASKEKMFNLTLPDFGPYAGLDYTRGGRHVVMAGRRGHVATFDWKAKKLGCELHLGETVRDVRWLHNETLFAVAQDRCTYIYDQDGTEVHCLRDSPEPARLDFLPFHFLLVTAGLPGYLRYQDVSTGTVIADFKTRAGECTAMAQNPSNAIIHTGHAAGVVALWSPSVKEPLVKMFCHKGPVQALAIDRSGKYMVSAGLDGRVKVWDVRTYKELHDYYSPAPASNLAISQLGLLAVSYTSHVTIWKDALELKAADPYMHHHEAAGSSVAAIRFCPYDDVLGVGHARGFASLAVPGAGEPNYDAFEGVNPYQTTQQRKTAE
ncbi:Small subunit (SSU) processome component, partial [Cladochytrium tenue]